MPCEIGGCREAAPDRRAPARERFTLDLATNAYLAYYILQPGDPVPLGCGVGDWVPCTVHPCRAKPDNLKPNAQAMGHHITGRLCIDGRGDWVPVIENEPQYEGITGWFAYAAGLAGILTDVIAKLGMIRGDWCFLVPIQLPFWTDANLHSAVQRCGGPPG